MAKIQAIIDLKSHRFIHLELEDYTKNDQKAWKDILSVVKTGDLVLRDLGCFVIATLQKLSNKAWFISKPPYGVSLYDPEGSPYFVGKIKIPLRVLAQPLANPRRRKAKKDRDKRKNHSHSYYYLLGYAIDTTNLDAKHYIGEVLHRIYRLRWGIETLFKCWKSHLDIKDTIHFNLKGTAKARILIYSCLVV